jgi:hypothetical protein
MNRIGQRWDRFQWASGGGRNASASVGGTYSEAWNLAQWVGQARDGAFPNPWAPGLVDTTGGFTGGFSGFGCSDSGGQRWATGYRRAPSDADRRSPDVDAGARSRTIT